MRTFSQTYKNSYGMSLVEVLVTMSLMSMIAVVGGMGVTYMYSARVTVTELSVFELRQTINKALSSDGVSCKGNFTPNGTFATPPGREALIPVEDNTPAKTPIDIKKGIFELPSLNTYVEGGSSVDYKKTGKVIAKGDIFKNDLRIVKIALEGIPTEDPKGNRVTRDLRVYFKRERVGGFSSKGGGDCTNPTQWDNDGCYAIGCQIGYKLNSTGNKFDTTSADSDCELTDCFDLSKGGTGGGGGAFCYKPESETDQNTHVGCGTTQSITGANNTALGFNAGNGAGIDNVFIGYNAGKSSITGSENVLLGNSAGKDKLTTGIGNVFIGNNAGLKNNGGGNVFVGRGAGENQKRSGVSVTYNYNKTNSVIIGEYAGYSNDGGSNVFLGAFSGNFNRQAEQNVFVGRSAGFNNTTASFNTFIGSHAGYDNTPDTTDVNKKGERNTFVGYYSGKGNTSGNDNIFLGNQAGKTNKKGDKNTFIGSYAGSGSEGGYNNYFLGYETGNVNRGHNNIFIGTESGKSNDSGNWNTFLGNYAGKDNTTGSDNIFIGKEAGKHNKGGVTKTGNRQLNIGNLIFGKLPDVPTNGQFKGHDRGFFSGDYDGDNKCQSRAVSGTTWTTNNTSCKTKSDCGTDTATTIYRCNRVGVFINGDLYVEGMIFKDCASGNCKQALYGTLSSSRVFKKNIKPYTDYRKSLEDLVKTPLFTYQYKNNLPKKTRMGVIAEELPQHLQIKGKNHPVKPDWVSIYGHLWAGIKALHEELNDFITAVLKKFNTISGRFDQIWIAITGLQTDVTQVKDRLSKLESRIQKLETKNQELIKENKTLREQLKQTSIGKK